MDDMKLPTGKTCADCVHIRRCLAFGFTEAENTWCDFSPSRFVSTVEKITVLDLNGDAAWSIAIGEESKGES